VGGKNYNTAASLGHFEVAFRANVDLLHNIDYWLSNLQRADADKNAPIRFKKAVHRLESAVFDFCQYGGASFFQRIVVALGQAERELSVSERFRDDKRIAPLTDLASTWVTAANNGSPEFTLALGLAAIVDTEQRIGPLRANLEAVDWTKRCRSWAEKDRSVVWNSDDLTNNLANVLQRRMMDSKRQGCTRLPLASPFTVNVDTIAAFIEGELDDTRIADLIWGLMLINHRDLNHARQLTSPYEQLSISRAYALLKLLFLPAPLAADRKDGRLLWRFANQDESGILIRPEPRILPLLRNGSVGEACRIAAQRLRSSGLPPIPGSLPNGKTRDDCWKEVANDIHYGQRLAAALLIPIDSRTLHDLILLVCRNQSTAGKALNNIEKEK
ncbi:type I-U CRISPR-associated protein Csx17, partial [Planctomycetota bacterium]